MRTKDIRKYKIMQPLLAVRDWFMAKTGLFELKSRIKQKIYFQRAKVEDEKRRAEWAEMIHQLPNKLLGVKDRTGRIVVSMTSFGYRIEQSAPYAILSILQQSRQPDIIVLNIDKNKWNDDNIPELLKKLQKVGVTINYTDDIGPHTKLIPALKLYPEDLIITADDDIFYEPVMIDELYQMYQRSDRKSVICREGKSLLKKNGKFLPYSQQPHLRECMSRQYVLPFGVAGVLYPPHVFGEEVFNTKVISELCPKADDIWFGVMELYYHISVLFVNPNSWTGTADVDRNEEYNEKRSGALHYINDGQGFNDKQWSNLMDYYNLG